MWHYLFENHFLIRLRGRFPVTRFSMLLYKPCGYQADDLRMSFTTIRFSHIPFSADVFRLRIKFSAVHVYAHTCIYPDKAAQMYFGRISLEHVLGMINFPQIVQTMIIQVICPQLSASSRLYVFRNEAV